MPYLGQSPSKGDENNFKILDDISSYTLTFDGSDSSVVSAANDTITSLTHRFVQGQRVTYNNGGGSNIAGLTSGTVYYIIKHDHHNIKLATSASNAANGTAVNITNVGGGASHTINVAFDGVNTKFKATHTNGVKAKITRSAQLVISINGVIQQPHDSATPSTGFGFDLDGTIVLSQAPVAGDVYWAHVLTNNNVTFDISDNDVDNFTGDGSTVSFNLSKTPPDNRNILVTIDGVVQYPNDPDGTARAYTVVENVLTFTTAPDTNVQIQVRHIGFAGSTSGSGGVTNFYGRTGAVVLKSTDNVTVNDAAITGNATVTGNISAADATFSGNLTVQGTTTTLDTVLTEVDKLEVSANNSTVGVAITQSGSGDILKAFSGSTLRVQNQADGNFRIKSGTQYKGLKVLNDVGNTVGEMVGLSTINDTGAMALWTGGTKKVQLSAAGDSYILDSNVGIGTDSPLSSVKLDVVGKGRFSDDLIILNGKILTLLNDANTANVKIDCDGGARLNIKSYDKSIIQAQENWGVRFFQGNETERLAIEPTGGIVVGAGGTIYIPDKISHSGDTDSSIRFPAHGQFSFETNGYERFKFTETDATLLNYQGNHKVGIGTDVLVAKLDVKNHANIPVLKLNDSHNNKYLTIQGGGAPNRMVIDSYEGSGGGAAIDLASNGDTKLRVTSAGYVGVATDDPRAFFHASRPSTAAVTLNFGDPVAQILQCEDSEFALGLHNVHPFPLYIQGRTRVNQARQIALNPLGGNVGIGTLIPSKTLHVDGTIFASGATTSLDGGLRIQPNNDGTNYGGVIYGGAHNDNNHAIYMRRGADGGNNTIDINSYGMFRVFTDGALASQDERLRIDSGGRVLIGTTSPLSFNGVGQYHNLIVAGTWNDTDITDNSHAAITISNKDGTANNTAGLHFAREDTDGNPHYNGASIVAQFLETMNTGHYPKADLAFLTSTANNNAPSEKMRLKADGILILNQTSASGTKLAIQTTAVSGSGTATGIRVGNNIGVLSQYPANLEIRTTGVENYNAIRTDAGDGNGGFTCGVQGYNGFLDLTTGGSNIINVKIRSIGSSYFKGGKVGIGEDPTIAQFQVKSAQLGGTAGNTQEVVRLLSPDVTNTTSYRFTNYRVSNGTSHSSSEMRFRRHVDATDMGYFGLGDGYASIGYGTAEYFRIISDGSSYRGGTILTEADLHWGHDAYQRPHIFSGAAGANPADGVVVVANPNTDPSATRIGGLLFGCKTSSSSGVSNSGLKAAIECYTNTNYSQAWKTGAYLNFLVRRDNGELENKVQITRDGLIVKRQDSGNEGGEIMLCRPSDDNPHFHIDAFGAAGTPSNSNHWVNNANPKMRIHTGGVEIFNIGTNGNIQLPRNPIFCGVYQDGGSTNVNSDPVIFNDTVYINKGAGQDGNGTPYNTSNGYFTCPSGGYYQVYVQAHLQTQSGGDYSTWRIYHNTTIVSNAWKTDGSGGSLVASVIVNASGGDTLRATFVSSDTTQYTNETYWVLHILKVG